MPRLGPVILGGAFVLQLGAFSGIFLELRAVRRSLETLTEKVQRASRAPSSRGSGPAWVAVPQLEPSEPTRDRDGAERVAERVLERVEAAAKANDPEAQQLARIEEEEARQEEAQARADMLVEPMLGHQATAEEWYEVGRQLRDVDPPELRAETIRRILAKLNRREVTIPPELNPIEVLEGIVP